MREPKGPEGAWGVFTRAELLAAGIDKSAITRRLRAGTLHRIVVVRGIRVTTVERTLLDLADVVSPRVLRRAARQAEVLRLPLGSPRGKAHGRRGAPSLAALSFHRAEISMTRSELESRFLRLCRRFDLPRPEVGPVIECREDDRRRDLALVRAGWRAVRFTYAQIAFDAAEVAAALRDVLSRPRRR